MLFIWICRIFKPKLSQRQPASMSLASVSCEITQLFQWHQLIELLALVATRGKKRVHLLGIPMGYLTFFFFPSPLTVGRIPLNLCTPCHNSSVQWTVENSPRESFQFFMVILVFFLCCFWNHCLIILRQTVYKLLGLSDFPPFQLKEFCLGYVLHSPPTHNSFLPKTFSLPSVLLTFHYF